MLFPRLTWLYWAAAPYTRHCGHYPSCKARRSFLFTLLVRRATRDRPSAATPETAEAYSWRTAWTPLRYPAPPSSVCRSPPSAWPRRHSPCHRSEEAARSPTDSAVPGRGRSPPPGIPAVAAPWPHRAAFLGPPLCHGPSRPRNTPCRGSGEEADAPLRQSAIPNGYPFSRAWGEGWDTGSSTRSDTHLHPVPRRGRLSAGRLA